MVSAIVLAAGAGKRLKSKLAKPLVKIGSDHAIIYSLKKLNRHPDIDEIIIVVSPANRKAIIRAVNKYSFKKVKSFVLGGARRQDSVSCGLKAVNAKSDLILIHDAARPFIEPEFISKVIQAAKKCGAAILGVPVKATIKLVGKNNLVKQTLPRSNLWEIQTPQVFKKDFICRAYQLFGKEDATDDASLVERSGRPVCIVLGSYQNIKITTADDLLLAKIIGEKK